jgi:DNA modification methylase
MTFQLNRFIVSDVFDPTTGLESIPDGIADCIVTSPPYWGKRDYRTGIWLNGDPKCDHMPSSTPNERGLASSTLSGGKKSTGHRQEGFKGSCPRCGAIRIDKQLGLEKTPEEFIQRMVIVFRECKRILKPHGTLWINIGDTYWSGKGKSGAAWDKYNNSGHINYKGQSYAGYGETRPQDGKHPIIKPKDLVGIPWKLAEALRAPFYTGRITNELDRVWMAAMIDGEGCFFIHKRKAGTSSYSKFKKVDGTENTYLRTKDTYSAGLEITNTDEAIIRRIKDVTGLGTITIQTPSQNTRRVQTLYRWRVSPNEAKRIAQETYPYLIGKQHQARLIFNCQSSGDLASQAHQAILDLHNGINPKIDFPAPPSLFEPGWYLRSEIIWAKRNPMPESAQDRCTSSHEHIFMLSKSKSYYFDRVAIAEEVKDSTVKRTAQDVENQKGSDRAYEGKRHNGPMKAVVSKHMNVPKGWDTGSGSHGNFHSEGRRKDYDHRGGGKDNKLSKHNGNLDEDGNLIGDGIANKRDVWSMSTQPYKGDHFATFPEELPRNCILAGTSAKGNCPHCGKPWVRISKKEFVTRDATEREPERDDLIKHGLPRGENIVRTIGWKPSCKCNKPGELTRPVVFDPFGGTGTTPVVADQLGRDWLAMELSQDSTNQAHRKLRNKLGPLLTQNL